MFLTLIKFRRGNMSSRIDSFYQYPIFQAMKGLPEEIVKLEADTGESLPDVFDYAFIQAIETESMSIVLGRIGEFYTVVVENEEGVKYEMHENHASLKLWTIQLVSDILKEHEKMDLTDEEWTNLHANIELFQKKVNRIVEVE